MLLIMEEIKKVENINNNKAAIPVIFLANSDLK
jgi:hypothetical protein